MPPRPLHVLIGGGGFMGGAYAKFLVAAGLDVRLVLRGALADEAASGALLDSLIESTHTSFVIVDFAYTSVPNSSFDDPVKDYSENLYNVLRHIDFARRLPHARYVYISSGGTVYGNVRAQQAISEAQQNVPLSPYGITKLACERYVLMHNEVHGIDATIVRPANVFGPGQKPFRGQGIVSTVAAKLLRGEPIQLYGAGLTVRDFLFVDDFCAALADIVAFGASGEIYNVGSQQGCSIVDLVAMIQTQLGLHEIEIETLPFRPFDVRFNVLETTKLRALNGWKPTVTVADGVAQTIAWLRTL